MDKPTDMPDRAAMDEMRKVQLERVRAAFGCALQMIEEFRRLSEEHPDDVELRGLTEMLAATFKQLLNTVTCKVLTNGLAADWVRLMSPEGEP